MLIENISDTARWVAWYRAMESARPDRIFDDPYAERLAGKRGEAIVRGMRGGGSWAWPMIVRTAVFDDLITRVIREHGVGTVLNLAAGLDTRPYRLEVPSTLRWIEIDFPAMINYKETQLADEQPRCQVERIGLDLSNRAARREIFSKINARSNRVLVIAEGLLVYLTEDEVKSLATDLLEQPHFYWWIIDMVSPVILSMMQKRWGKHVDAANAPFRFAPENGPDFYRALGWNVAEFRSTMTEALRLRRAPKSAILWPFFGLITPKKRREQLANGTGYVLLERAAK